MNGSGCPVEETRRGVVLAGGGSRGAYQIGVWRAMRECGITYSVVTGTSVGALNGAMMVQGDYERARKMWLRLTAQDIAKIDLTAAEESADPGRAIYAQFLRQAVLQGGVDITGLESIMRGVIDCDRFYDSPVEYGLVTVKYPTFEHCTLRKNEIDRDKLCDYLIASASCFPAFPAKKIGSEQFVDGAYYDIMPINLAVDLGAREIIAVDLEGIGIKRRPKDRAVPLTVIRPVHPLGPTLEFEPDSAAHNMRMGYLDALRAFGRAEGGFITLRAGQTRALMDELDASLRRSLELCGFSRRGTQAPMKPEQFERAIEQLAEWYDMDIETLYTAQEYCYELLLRFNATQPLMNREVSGLAARAGTVRRFAKFGRRALVSHLYACLRDLSFGRGDRREMARLSRALANETNAALILFALKSHLAGESQPHAGE